MNNYDFIISTRSDDIASSNLDISEYKLPGEWVDLCINGEKVGEIMTEYGDWGWNFYLRGTNNNVLELKVKNV